MNTINNNLCWLFAGHCSTDESNKDEAWEMAAIRELFGLRLPGLKSRTSLTPDSMGMDFPTYQNNLARLLEGAQLQDLETLPSVKLAAQIHEKTGVTITAEIMDPVTQLAQYTRMFPNGGFMPWNPSVNQLGLSLYIMAEHVKKNNWLLGIKNSKCLGGALSEVEVDNPAHESGLEKTWLGLTTYAQSILEKTFLIHRGVDVPENGAYRNYPVHQTAGRVKFNSGCKMLFDPSHIFGPKLRHKIVEESVNALKMQLPDGSYLYDGLLIEVGTSKTDTQQHITLDELNLLIERVGEFREFAPRL